MPDKSKFEQEIDEILEKSDADKLKYEGSRKKSFEPFSPTVPKRSPRGKATGVTISPGNLIITGVVMLALAAFTPFAKLPLGVIGFGLVVIGYVLWFRRGRSFSGGSSGWRGRASRSEQSEPQVKYWRGRRIEDKPDIQGQDDRGKIIDFTSAPDDSDEDK